MIDWKPIVRARLEGLSLQPSVEAELTEELAQHLEDLYHDLLRGGRAPGEASRITLSELDELCAVRLGLVDGSLFQARIGVALLSIFGLIALGLASIGLYGILVYTVNQRTREIGLRMALGATQGSVRRLIVMKGMSLVLAGLAIGFAAALLVARALSRMLYGVGATDPLSLAGAVTMLAAIALVACYLPSRRATRVDPLVALRQT